MSSHSKSRPFGMTWQQQENKYAGPGAKGSKNQHREALGSTGQEFYDAVKKFPQANRSFSVGDGQKYSDSTGTRLKCDKGQRDRLTSNASTNSDASRRDWKDYVHVGGDRNSHGSRRHFSTSNGNRSFHAYSGVQQQHSKVSGVPDQCRAANGYGSRTNSDSSYHSAVENNFIRNFQPNNTVDYFGSYLEKGQGNQNAMEQRGRDKQRRGRNSSSRSVVGASNQTFHGFDHHHDKSFLDADYSMLNEVFSDNITSDARKLSEGHDGRDARTNNLRSSSHRSRSKKSTGCHNDDIILVQHRPARNSDEMLCARPPLPRGGQKVALNQTFTGIEGGISQANTTTGRGNGNCIPVKHRAGGTLVEENKGCRSQSKPRFANKSFYGYEYSHTKGLDTARYGKVFDKSNRFVDTASSVTKQSTDGILQTVFGSEMSGDRKTRNEGPENVSSDKESAKDTAVGTGKCAASGFDKVLNGHNETGNKDAVVYQETASKLNKTFGGFDSSLMNLTGAEELGNNSVAVSSDDGWQVDASSDVVKESDVVVNKVQKGPGFNNQDELNISSPKAHAMENAICITANVIPSDQWTHFKKMKQFASDVLPSEAIAGVYTCMNGEALDMPYIAIVENFIFFYGKDEEPQKMPPNFQFELLPLVTPSDDRVVPGIYHFISAEHDIWPSVMSLGEHLNNVRHSNDIIDYTADNLNQASASSVPGSVEDK